MNFNPAPLAVEPSHSRANPRGIARPASGAAEVAEVTGATEEGIPVPGAAGTATRTLREQVAMLQQSKEDLEVDAKVKSAENEALRQRLQNLEGVLLEDLDQRISSAISAANQTWITPGGKGEGGLNPKQISPKALYSSTVTGAKGEIGGQIWNESSLPTITKADAALNHLVANLPTKPVNQSGQCALKGNCKESDTLRKELSRSLDNYDALMQDYEALEQTLLEVQRTASGYAARYAFCLLDEDHDGLIGLEEVMRYELFLPYSVCVLQHCYQFWQFMEVQGRMNSEDFLNFTQYAEDKTTRPSQLFWFRCADVDGDGYIGRHDVRWLYDQVDKSGGCISFDDLYEQIIDMCLPACPERGVSMADIRSCKLASGIFSLLFNHNNLLLRRTTAEFSLRNDVPM